MRDRRTWTVLLAGLAWLSLSSGGTLPAGLAGAGGGAVTAPAPWTPEVPAIEAALAELGTPLSRSERGRVARTVVAEARRAGFSPEFVLAVIQVESAGDPFAVSSKGALGDGAPTTERPSPKSAAGKRDASTFAECAGRPIWSAPAGNSSPHRLHRTTR
jgi:hypothetical protein